MPVMAMTWQSGRRLESHPAVAPVRVYTRIALALSCPASVEAAVQISSDMSCAGEVARTGYFIAPNFSLVTQSSTSLKT